MERRQEVDLVTRSIRARGATRLQHLLDIPSHVQNIMDLSIHRGVVVALVVAQLRTGVDLRALTMLPQGAPSVVFENLIHGYDETACEVASVVSLEDLIRWAP